MSPFSIECPDCHKSLKATSQHIGKRAKCPSCGSLVLIAKPPASAPERPGEPDEPVRSGESNEAVFALLFRVTASGWQTFKARSVSAPVTTAITTAALLLGFFAGRYHMKSEISESFVSVFKSELSTIPGATRAYRDLETNKRQIEEENKQPALSIGTLHQAEGFSLALVDTSIATVELKTFSDVIDSSEKYLQCTFRVYNTDERKLLNYREGYNSRFSVVDDVGNLIRGVDFGFGADIKGQISTTDDIQPSDSRNHIEIFSIPPEKTKYLIVTVDLKSFGGDGRIKYKVPANRISGFPVAE